MQNRSKSTLASWNVGFFSSIRGISIPDWTLRGYTPTFQLGYAMGKNAREHAVAVLN